MRLRAVLCRLARSVMLRRGHPRCRRSWTTRLLLAGDQRLRRAASNLKQPLPAEGSQKAWVQAPDGLALPRSSQGRPHDSTLPRIDCRSAGLPSRRPGRYIQRCCNVLHLSVCLGSSHTSPCQGPGSCAAANSSFRSLTCRSATLPISRLLAQTDVQGVWHQQPNKPSPRASNLARRQSGHFRSQAPSSASAFCNSHSF